jgi:uncharacterized membrane protein
MAKLSMTKQDNNNSTTSHLRNQTTGDEAWPKHLLILLFFNGLFRLMLVFRNSYWYDEFHSVFTYGVDNPTALSAIENLANNSIHPPLYQFILYHWMRLFGPSQFSTRLLSIVYALIAIYIFYRLCEKLSTSRLAFTASLFFSISYIVVYYSIEIRSYAQTLLL